MCTGIRLTATDGTVVCARTLEFAVDLESEVLVVPRGLARAGVTPDGRSGFSWTTKCASVGANGVDLPYPEQLRHPAWSGARGQARRARRDEHGNAPADYTTWTSANDLAAKRFYFRTYDSSRIRQVDLMKMDLDAREIVTLSMGGAERFEELGA